MHGRLLRARRLGGVRTGLKTLEDAGHLRSHILGAFEMANLAPDPAERAAYLTFAVIGAGPTGVEVAGDIAELAHETLPREYKSITTTEAKILLIEAGPQVLAAFGPGCSAIRITCEC